VADFADDTSTELERKIKALEVVALIEGVSYIGLFLFWVSDNVIGTKLFGSIHGWIFIAFALMVAGVRRGMQWTWLFVATAVLTGPLGAVLVWWRIRRHGVPATARMPGRATATATADA
jgi:integral membrane protein